MDQTNRAAAGSTPSASLAAFLDWVKAETGREVLVHHVQATRLPGWIRGMTASFRPDPEVVRIVVDSSLRLTDPAVEQSIAHEAAHGLLLYGRGYWTPIAQSPLSQSQTRLLSLPMTMIDDIPANKCIQEHGFDPFGASYLATVERETKSARHGRDYYQEYSADPSFKDTFMVFRYVLAWGFREYFSLEFRPRRTLREFLKAFETAYGRQYSLAVSVIESLGQHSVFSADEHRVVMMHVLHLWRLDSLVEMKSAV